MAAAAASLETPVISGNVSLYNESYGTAIYPDAGRRHGRPDRGTRRRRRARSRRERRCGGAARAWLAAHAATSAAARYLAAIHATVAGRPPQLDLELERAVQQADARGHRRRADPQRA